MREVDPMEIVPALLAENFDDCVKILTQAESFIDLGVDYACVGSRTPGHPEYGETPGVECTIGSLDQGFGMSVGMAIAERFLAAKFNRPGFEIINHYTYPIVSDGDFMEGVSSETASLAGHLKLAKLIYLYDNDHISLVGETRLNLTEGVCKRFEAYGLHVQVVDDGNDIEATSNAITLAQSETAPLSLIATQTHIGYGSPHRQDTFEAHGSPLRFQKPNDITVDWQRFLR